MMRRTEGFTLIELFVALAILAFGLLALSQMGVMAIGSNRGSSEESIATRLAQNKIDELKKEPYASLVLQNFTDPKNPMNSQEGKAGGIYNRTWSIASGPTTGTKKVAVKVTWDNGARQVNLKTLVADDGN